MVSGAVGVASIESPFLDPQSVPVIATDGHLPQISPQALHPIALVQKFQNRRASEIPGLPVQASAAQKMIPAAVLIPLVMRARLMVVMTQRARHLAKHSGQIAFPGGRVDPQDVDAIAAALREAEEEIGLSSRFVQVLGCLSPHVTSSDFLVTPVVALVHAQCQLTPNPSEVSDIFEVPLDFVLNPANHRHHVAPVNGQLRSWISISYNDAGKGRFIWGASAAMLRELYQFMCHAYYAHD